MTSGRLLITGGSSYFGRYLVRLVAERYPADQFVYSYFSADPLTLPQGEQLDLRDAAHVQRLVTEFQPEAIIHLAGSNGTPDMTAVIEHGAGNIVAAARAVGARLIHMSTDAVFDGRQAPYDERALPQPINPYGLAKAAAEEIVGDNYANSAIVRTSLIYGLSEMDHGTAWMSAALHAGEQVTLFTNQYRNPVWAESLARACLEMVDPATAAYTHTGLLNVAGRQPLSRAEFGLKMLDYWKVTERDSLHLANDESGRWPLDCTMDVSSAEQLLETPLLGVDEVLGL